MYNSNNQQDSTIIERIDKLKQSPYLNILNSLLITMVWFVIYIPFLFSQPAGIDFAAHLFRVAYLSEYGLTADWNPLWYTGTPFLNQYAPGTTFILWIMSFIIPMNLAYVFLLIASHLIISLSVYLILKRFDRSNASAIFGALFIMTLPSLNANFMFYSRAPTQVGLAIFGGCLVSYYNEKRFLAVSIACLLSITHYMIFGFLIVIVATTEVVYLAKRVHSESKTETNDIAALLKAETKSFGKRISIWAVPFVWVFLLMPDFFQEPINLIMLSRGSLLSFTDGPGGVYWILRIFRDFLYNYISVYVFMFLIIFAFSIWVRKINLKELGVIITTLLIIITGFLLFYEETNKLLPLAFRGMDVLRFILISQILIVILCVRGIEHKGTIIIMGIIVLLPLAEAHNGIINFGYLQFDDNHWDDLTPLAEELRAQNGYYYVCPKGYQGDHMAYLPILSGKPYFDGWNPPGCQLNWFRDPPPSSSKYRPDLETIYDIIYHPEKYGVKWMFTRNNDFLLNRFSHWERITDDLEQNKLLWKTTRNISLVDVYPDGSAQFEYQDPTRIEITVTSLYSEVDLLVRVAYHPKWHVATPEEGLLVREEEIGFMLIQNVSTTHITLQFLDNHLSMIFIAFVQNIGAIIAGVGIEGWIYRKKRLRKPI